MTTELVTVTDSHSPTASQSNEADQKGNDIAHYIAEITEMVAFLDYSFERAFTIKEKSYIRAYKDHVLKIQTELDKLREVTFDKKLLDEKKEKKVAQFKSRLEKIKSSALFMGEMSELHTQALREQKAKQGEMEYELRFCQDMI